MSTNKTVRLALPALIVTGAMLISIPSLAQAADNTANNKQHNVTADQQSNAASDRAITQKIRKALIADNSLSTYAHNVKIITANGAVTLKGPVKSENEKQQVASTAAQFVGTEKVKNELTVKAE